MAYIVREHIRILEIYITLHVYSATGISLDLFCFPFLKKRQLNSKKLLNEYDAATFIGSNFLDLMRQSFTCSLPFKPESFQTGKHSKQSNISEIEPLSEL